MFTIDMFKNKKKSLVTKVFSYIVLVFAFLFVGFVDSNKNVGAWVGTTATDSSGTMGWTELSVSGSCVTAQAEVSNIWSAGVHGLYVNGTQVYYNNMSDTKIKIVLCKGQDMTIQNVAGVIHGNKDPISGTERILDTLGSSGKSFTLTLKAYAASYGNATCSTTIKFYVPPTVSLTTSTAWQSNHTVKITATSNSGASISSVCYIFKSYSTITSYSPCHFYNGSTKVNMTSTSNGASHSGSSSWTGTYYFLAVAQDSYGNFNYAQSSYKFDNTIPYLNSYYSSGTSDVTYKKSDSHYAYASSFGDNHSGVWSEYAYFCLDQSSSLSTDSDLFYGDCSYKVPMSTSAQYFPSNMPTGLYYLYYYIEDNVGNYTGGKSGRYFYVDSTAPTLSSATASSTTYVREKTVTIKYYDYHSKVSTITYCWAKNTSCTPNTTLTATAVDTYYGYITLDKNSVTGIYYIYFYATDKAGNKSSTTEYRYYYLDYDAPDFSSASPASDTTYTKSKTVTITYSDVYESSVRSGVKSILYCWTTSSSGCTPNLTLSSTGSVSITKSDETGIYYLSVYGIDNATNYSNVTTKGPYYFDNTNPTWGSRDTNVEEKVWTTSVTTTVTYEDNHSRVKTIYYCWDKTKSCTGGYSSKTASDGAITVTKNTDSGKFYFIHYAVDNAGNTSTTSRSTDPYYIDNTDPSFSSATASSSTYVKSKTVSISYTDDHSGVDEIYYCWTTSPTSCSGYSSEAATISGTTGTISITKDTGTGKYYLYLYATDDVGNTSLTSSAIRSYYFDNAAPVFSSFAENGSTTWVPSREVTITYHDKYDDISRSGVKYIYYCWAESANASTETTCTPESKSETTGTLKISKTDSGYWWLTVKAEDNLGNVSGIETSPVFYFDNTVPADPTFTASDTTWRQSKTVTLTSSDGHSGVDGFYYCTYFKDETACTPSTWLDASSGRASITLTTSGKRYVRAYAVDNAGNVSGTTTSGVYWIDSDDPYLSGNKINPNGNSTYAKSQSATVTYSDNHSGVNTIEYCWNTSSTANSVSSCTSSSNSISGVTGNYYLHVRAYDNSTSANYSEWTVSNVFKLDNTDPEFVSRSPDGDENYTKSKSVVVTYTDGHSGVATIKYCWTTSSSGCTPSSIETASDGKITINRNQGSGTYYLSTLAIDAAGNDTSSTTSTTKYNFDNTAPSSPTYDPTENTTYAKSQSVVVTYTDSHSGVGIIEYCWSTSSSTVTCSSPSTVSNGGTVTRNTGTDEYYLVTRARDSSLKGDGGASANYNWSSWSNSGGNGYYVDNTKPDNPAFNPNEDGVYTKSKAIQIESYDRHSGLDKIYYCWTTDSSGCTPSSNKTAANRKISVTKNTGTGIYYLSAYAVDKAGNVSETTTSGAYYFDNTAPSLTTFNPDGNSGWQKQVTVTVTYSDGHSGVVSISYCWAEGTSVDEEATCTPDNTVATSTNSIDVPSSTIAGIYYLNVKSTDAAGNVSDVSTSNAYKLAVSQELKSDGSHYKYYHSIQDGLDGITAGNTLKVLLDSTSTLEGDKCLTNDKNITLNMNGKQMTCSIASTPGLTNSGTLTINGSGTITSSDAAISNSGNLTITNGTFTGAGRGIYSSAGSVTINGGTINGNGNDGIHVLGSLTINDGTVNGADDGVQNGGTGTVTIAGGSVTGIAGAWNAAGGTMKVTGGTIKGTSSSYGGLYNSATLEISGGTIEGTYGVSNAGTATISGGTMSTLNNAGTVTISGTAKISGAASNSSSLTMSGGETGAMTSSGTTTLNGGTVASLEITDGTSTVGGGTVSGAVSNAATFNMTSGTIGSLDNTNSATISGGTVNGAVTTSSSLTVSGGTISGTLTSSAGTSDLSGGTIAELTVSGDTTNVKGSTVSGAVSNSATLNVSSGTISGGITNSATLNVSGGTVSGTTGISTTAGTVTVSGGTVVGTSSYAINATGGTVNYTGGTLKGSTSNIYTYYMKSGVTFSIGDRSEYTYISSSQYITVLNTAVATIGSTNYNTLQAALNAGGTITLNKNVTDLSLTVASGKNVTLNLNGKTLNSFITARVQTAAGTTNFITNNGTLTVYNGTIKVHREGVGIYNNGTLNYGRSTDTLGTTPELNVTKGYAINNVAGKILNFNNGKLVSSNKSNVVNVQNKDLYMRSGHYMDFSATAPYSVVLKSGTILGGSSMTSSTSISGTTLTVVVNHTRSIAGTDESVKVWLRTGGSTGEYAMSCTSSGTKTTCTTSVTSSFAYLYNSTYEGEILVAYVDNEGSYIDTKEILRRDLLIIPEILSSDNTAGAEVNKDGYSLFSDGKTIMIALNSATLSEVSINEAVILKAIFGDNYATILGDYTVGLNNVDTSTCSGVNGCVGFDTTTMTISASYNGGYPAAINYILNNQAKIMVYDYTPKFSESSVTALSATTCELGSACNVTPLSYYDYQGNPVGTVSNTITYNGELVDRIDSSKLGTYLVTTVAEDNYGNRSKAVVREYKVVDTTAPTIEVSKEALVVKQGEELNDLDEVVVSDNYDQVLMIERISEEIDTNKVGTYKLGYKVVDSNGNETIVYRDVVVKGDNTKTIMITIMITTLLSTVLGIGTYYFIKRRKSYLN